MTYGTWIKRVRAELESMHMATDEWQAFWTYNFHRSYQSGTAPTEAAERAHRFWWREQYKLLHNECTRAANCCLQRGHQGECQPIVGSCVPDPAYKHMRV
ncbi:MAG: hypothetical protein ACRD3E_04940 [Terriglobales bacterium]